MECDLCGTVNRANARFCGGCGSALARRCPSCKAELDAGLSFCDQCGTTLDATPTSSPSPTTAPTAPAGAVRKTVTVLFADLGGSTGFGERTDPEISRQVLATYHALLQETIDAHGGTVAKFMGDGMMATFGIPEVAEDDARRAVEAGTDMQRRFEAFAADVLARFGETLTMRVGINTGEVVIASGDADLVGDALNVAARLEKACRPGHVLVGDETWRITRGDLAYEPLGEVTVAGRAGPVGTYEVIGTGAATIDPVAPFVGRVGETARLRAAFERAGTNRQAVLVTVLGSPGMGKTRLSRELASTLAADEDATTFEIRCDRSGGATFAPFADLVREAAGIAEIEDGEDAAEATRDRIGALVRDEADRGRVVDVIAGVLGAAPARSVEETFWGIRRVVESLATDRPLVVVIDDIQWAEPKLLDLLEHLAEWVQAAAVLLVCLARPELRELRPALTEPGRRVADVLALDGLDASATAELAAGLLGSALPSELIDRLPVSTDGNPLFVRELVRMLVDDAVIRRRDDGAWELAIDAEAIEVPPTIQSLLATRVERLPAEELRVLELASVVGAEFSVGALRELAGNDIAVPAVLERLRRKELVEPTGSYWGDDPLHRFHHVLIRDAAYRRLLKTTRAELHRQVGEWTDASASDLIGEHETAIAFHFEQAHRYWMELGTVDEETDRLGRRAAELLGVAARRALDREDLTSAGALARRALAALPDADVDDRAELLLIACECFLSSGDVTAGAPLVDALVALTDDNDQLGAWAACYRAQLIGLTDPDGVVAAEETASAAAATLERFGDGAGEAKAQQVRAGLLARLGRVGEAEVVLDLALGAARASDDRRRVTAVLGAAPQAALFGPSPVARAGGRCLDVVRLLRITTASSSVEATSMRCQAVLEALRGRFDVSRSMLASARASLEELGLRHGLLETDLFTGMVELIAGDPGAAIVPLRSAYEGLGTLGVGADAGQAAALLATALLARGEIDEAELMAGESEALAGQNLKTAIAWRIARAEVHAARGDAAAGVTLAEEAVQIAAGTDLILDHADACVVLADLCGLAGDAPAAERARDEARRLYEAKGATVPAGRLSDVSSRSEIPVQPPVRAPEPVVPGRDGEARTALAVNAATRFLDRLRVALNAGDYEAAGRLTADGYVFEDRRSIVAVPDVEALTSDTQAATAQGFVILEPEVVAVRGERLCLRRLVYRTPGGDESPRLVLDELDANGQLARSVFFDEADLTVALAELDRSYYLGEGAPYQRVLGAVGRYSAAVDGHDMDKARDLLAPDFEMVDHGPLGFGAGDRDYFVDMTRLAETDDELVNCVIHVNEHALLAVYLSRPITDEGSRYERSGVTVMGIDASDRVNRIEMFADDQFTAALARLDELGAAPTNDPRTATAENPTTRLIARTLDLMNRGEWEALAAMNVAADDVVRFDRRRTVSAPTLTDSDSVGANAAGIYEVFGAVHPEPVAVRGERLALIRLHCGEPPAFTMQMLVVYELDDAGRIVREVDFDDDDLVDALTELDARYAAGEGAEFAAAVRPGVDHLAAFHARDWDALAASVRGYEIVDHRGLWPDAGPDAHVERMQSLAATAPDATIVSRKLHVHGDAVLMTADVRATAEHGDRHEYTFHTVGRPGRFEYFDEHDFAAALARLDELGAEVPTDPRTAKAENVTTGLLEQVVDHLVNRRFDLMRELLADDFVRDDRRHGVSAPYANGPDEWIAHSAANFDVGFDAMDRRPIAVRGEHLALFRIAWTSTDGRFVPFLSVFESDGIGRLVRSTHFDEDDLVAALAELDERFLGSATHDPFNARDWAAMKERFHPDLIFVDRRELMWPALDRDAFVEMQRGYVELVPDMVFSTRVVHFQSPAMLMVLDSTGTMGDGAAVGWNMVSVGLLGDDGLILRLELFDESDFPVALARLDELGAQVPVGDPSAEIANAATAAQTRVIDVCHRRRFDELRALLTDDFVREDRRHGVAAPTADGPEEFVRAYAAWFDVGFETLQARPVAVRGDRLVLVQFEWQSADDRSVGFLAVYELAGDDRFARGVHFDEEDLDAALDELDERWIAGEGAEHEYLVRRIDDFRHARAARDWDGVEALFSPDYVAVDRRPLGLGAGTRDQYLAASRAMVDLVPDATFVPRAIEASTDVVLMRTAGSGISVDGSRSEWEQWVVWQFAGGRVVRGEVFSLEDEPAARARFEELAHAARLTPYIDNRLVRVGERARWLARHSAETVALYSADCVLDDRRPGVNAGTVRGSEAVAASIQSGIDVFGVLDLEQLAVRGDRLTLFSWAFVAEGGFEAPGLCVNELDDDDLICRVTSFDESDLAGAIELLEQRHVELRGDSITPQELTTAVGSRAFNARDWDATAGVFGRDLRFVTHAPFTTEGGWDDYLAQLRVLVEQVPDVAVVYAKVTTRGRCGLSLLPFTATTPEGSRYSWSMVQVTRMGDDDRIAEFELFDIEQWDDAAARFEQWSAEPVVPTGAEQTTSVENRASRITAEAARRFGVEGGLGSEHQADDLVRVDHRRMIGVPTTTTREEFADAARAFADLGMTDMTFDVLAVRGDRCCLGRLTYSGADFDVRFLTVVACNDRNKTAWIDNFDEDALDAALDTLDERFIAGEGAEHHNVIRWWREFGAAYRDRDWAAVEEMYVSDAVLVDHWSIGQSWTNRADFLTSTRAVVELVPDVAHLPRRLEIRGPVTLTDGEAFGTTSDGSRYTWGYQMVTQWAGGRITRLEMFDAEASAAARARFDELAGATVKPDNAAARLIVDASRLLWTDLDAALDRFSPDAIGVARESGPSLGLSAENRAMWRDVLGSLAETYDDVRYETLAIRGDRLALLRQEFVTDGYVTPALLMVETDEHNQIVRLETFAEEDLSRASEELDRRSSDLLGDAPGGPTFGPRAELGAMVQSISGTFAARDWESIRSRFTPDAVLEDRRSTVSSHRAVGAEVGELFRGFADVGFETLDQIELASRGEHLVLVRQVYRSATGFELEMLVVIESQADGRMAAITLFDADALVPALDELELRYARSGTLTHSVRQVLLVGAGLNHRRWRELDAVLAPDVDVVDHRRLGFPPATGKQHLIGALQALVVQVPDVVAIVRAIEVSGPAVLAVVDQVGTSTDGVAADWAWYSVVAIDAHGLIARMEYFDIDDAARARARFEEFARRDR